MIDDGQWTGNDKKYDANDGNYTYFTGSSGTSAMERC